MEEDGINEYKKEH